METYDKNQFIKAEYTDFEDLREQIKTMFDARLKGMGDSAVDKFEHYNNVINPLNEIKNEVIEKVMGNSTVNALVNLKMENTPTQSYEIIPALTEFFAIVNNLINKTDSANNGCDAACSGLCYGTCGKSAYGYDSATHTSGSSTYTNGSLGTGCNGCAKTCSGDCHGAGFGAEEGDGCGCGYNCSGSCSGSSTSCSCGGGCTGRCNYTCYGGCSGCGGCDSWCGGSCSAGCSAGCKNHCGSACQGTCQYGTTSS